MKKALIAIGVLVGLAVLFGLQLMSMRNELVTQHEAMDAAFAQVDVVLQRRADLIPNLVKTVEGFAAQEKEVFTAIANARKALAGADGPAQKIEANTQLDGALARLLVIAEAYPQLKSDANFLRLQDELAGTENRIAVERRKYNESVQKYNINIELFPQIIAAKIFGCQRNDAYFKTDPASRQAPQVDFNKK